MSISDEELLKLSELARLNLSEEERSGLREDLNEILGLAESIQDLDTGGVEPTYHAMPLENVTREDESRPSPDAAKVLRNAPDSSDGYFVVPRVIED